MCVCAHVCVCGGEVHKGHQKVTKREHTILTFWWYFRAHCLYVRKVTVIKKHCKRFRNTLDLLLQLVLSLLGLLGSHGLEQLWLLRGQLLTFAHSLWETGYRVVLDVSKGCSLLCWGHHRLPRMVGRF